MLIYGFNEACKDIPASYLKVGDESMSEICFCTTEKGNLTNLSYMLCNPEPLETEFKTVSGYFTGSLLLIDTQRGEEVIKNRNYHLQIGSTISCTKIILEATKGIIQKDVKGTTKYCFLFEKIYPQRSCQNL